MKLPIPSNASSAHFLPSARERYSSVFPSHFVRTIERASEILLRTSRSYTTDGLLGSQQSSTYGKWIDIRVSHVVV